MGLGPDLRERPDMRTKLRAADQDLKRRDEGHETGIRVYNICIFKKWLCWRHP